MNIGDKVQWNAVNGPRKGIVHEEFDSKNFLVRLDNGCFVVVRNDCIVKVK